MVGKLFSAMSTKYTRYIAIDFAFYLFVPDIHIPLYIFIFIFISYDGVSLSVRQNNTME